MHDFDKYIKQKIENEEIHVPDSIHESIENTLNTLPKYNKRIKTPMFSKFVATAACFLFLTLFLLPNVNVAYAQTISQIPIIGDLVEVLTIRNYFYTDERHDMDIDVPNVVDTENSEAAERINANIDELTSDLLKKFYDELEITGESGYGAIYVDYNTVMNAENWFTLKLSVSHVSGSSDQYYKYYHIDRRNGQYVEFKDLFSSEEYKDIIIENIKEQMTEQMKNNEGIVYFVDDVIIGEEFASLDDNQNFYFNDKNKLVIVFDKYEVAPGSMGCLEFEIDYVLIENIVKEEFKDILGK